MASDYFRISVKNLPSEREDFLSGLSFEWGAAGVSESCAFHQNTDTYEPVVIESDFKSLDIFFETPPKEEFIAQLKKQFPQIEIQLHQEAPKDWLAEWKKDYKAFRLTHDIWVVPSWLEVPGEAKQSLQIDPGMAFGTGTHDTTQLAADILFDLLSKFQAQSLIDVGTGTGILAMVAELKGVKQIEGTEIDPEARRVARNNLELNQSRVQIVEHQIEDVQSSFDVVVANIIDGVLIRLSEHLIRVLKPGGYLLLTGVLNERAPIFESHFYQIPQLKLQLKSEKGEWFGYLFQKNA